MPKRATLYSLDIPPQSGRGRKWRDLYATLRTSILTGELAAGSRLPATRELARTLGVARGTVSLSYDLLLAEGFLTSQGGRGTFVANGVSSEKSSKIVAAAPVKISEPHISRRGRALLHSPYPSITNRNFPVPFTAFLPDLSEFPHRVWQQLSITGMRNQTAADMRDGDAQGYLPLREALTDYLRAARGLKCTPDNIFILSSTMQALDLTLRLFTDPGDAVIVEDPCYRGALQLLKASQVEILPLTVDENGMQTENLIKMPSKARLIYTTPAHQAPLGSVLSGPRRLFAIQWARANNSVIFEDDYDGEYRYSGHPIPALQSNDRFGVVMHGGTFSKTLFPALRLAYLVVPDRHVSAFRSARSLTSRFPQITDQRTLTEFIREGHFARHLSRMRRIYSERREALSEAFNRYLDGIAQLSPIQAGLQTICHFNSNMSEDTILQALRKSGLELHGLKGYQIVRRLPPSAVLGFAPFQPEKIANAARTMAASLEKLKAE